MAGRPSPGYYAVRAATALPRAGAFCRPLAVHCWPGLRPQLRRCGRSTGCWSWCVAGLSAIGTLLVWSATQPSLLAAGQDPRTYLKKQLLWVVIGLILMFAVSFVD